MNESTKVIQKYLNDTITDKELKTLSYFLKHPKIKEDILPTLQLEADLRVMNSSVDISSKTMSRILNKGKGSKSDTIVMKKPLKRSSFSKKSRPIKSDDLKQKDSKKVMPDVKKKEIIYIGAATLCFVIIGLSVILSHTLGSDGPAYTAEVSRSYGQVQVKRDGLIMMAGDEFKLMVGDQITLGQGAECRFSYPGLLSEVVLTKASKLELLFENGFNKMFLHHGVVYGHISSEDRKTDMLVETELARLYVSKSQYRLESRPDLTQADVTGGEVLFESISGIKKAMLGKGEVAKIGPRIPLTVERK